MTGSEAVDVRVSSDVPAGATLCRPVFADGGPADGRRLDEPSARFAALAGFAGARAQTCPVIAGDAVELLVGLGPRRSLSVDDAAAAVADAVRRLRHTDEVLAVVLDGFGRDLSGPDSVADVAGRLAAAAVAAGYDYRRPAAARGPVQVVVVTGAPGADTAVARGRVVGAAMSLTRDLVNEPAVTMTPTHFVERARDVAHTAGLDIRVWGPDDIAEQRLGGLAAIASGSRQPAYLIRLEHRGAEEGPATALVGKGVMFDSGGLSLKSADYMVTMKIDMCGAATVLGAMSALAALGVRKRVRAYLPVTENMPGGAAVRPGDVAVMRNGLHVEIVNTDAEGRMILADALAVAVDEGADRLVDVASLTGACRVALGTVVAGVMSNDEAWSDAVLAASARVGERMWPLPMIEEYKAQLTTPFADMRNLGQPVRPNEAGAIVAALFLREFTGGLPWVHIDMGGPAYHDVETASLAQGSTGFGVRTLLSLVGEPDGSWPIERQGAGAESA